MTAALALTAAAALIAAPPQLRAGDAFVYSDGHVEQVRGFRDGQTEWGGLEQRSHWRPRHPVLPITAWTSGRGEGRRHVVGAPDDLWPMGTRRSVQFRVVTEVRQRNSENWVRDVEHWRCRVGHTAPTSVPAGEFLATHISCDRHSPTTMRLLERHEWDYAPELGHHVRRTWLDYGRATRRSVELVAALAGPAASQARLKALARQLDRERRRLEPRPAKAI